MGFDRTWVHLSLCRATVVDGPRPFVAEELTCLPSEFLADVRTLRQHATAGDDGEAVPDDGHAAEPGTDQAASASRSSMTF
jgi:hypothetical protein